MNNFWRRLRYYGIGFGIGLIFVIFFFSNRGCSWTPSNRVKSALLERVIALPESQQEAFSSQKIEVKNWTKFIQDAEIDFKASNKTDKNKYYVLKNGTTTLFFTLTNYSFVTSVYASKPKPQDWQQSKARLVAFPANKDLVFTDTTGVLGKTRVEMGYKDDRALYKQLKKNGQINYGKSDFIHAIKPEHHLELTNKKGQTFGMKSVWYQEKIFISEYFLPDTLAGYTK